MSTRYIRTLMNMTGCSGAENCIHCKVKSEVEAIEKSARATRDMYIDDSGGGSDDMSGMAAWDLLGRIAKESK